MASPLGLGAALAVLVVYRRPWEEVHAADWLTASLTGCLAPDGSAVPKLGRLLVYDNSPEPTGSPAVHLPDCDYVHDASNGGTRAAYIRALELAQLHGLAWVILLDHDTTVTSEYFDELDLRFTELDARVGLLFPRVVGNRGALSPAIINRWGSIIPFDSRSKSVGNYTVTAVASGSVIRTQALSAVGEIPPTLWLDYLDHWLFRNVQSLGFGVQVLSSAIRHDLSVHSNQMPSYERLGNILRGEQFLMGMLGASARAVYPLRLLARAVKMLPRDVRSAWLIFRQIFRVQPHR
jgi:GT2 family glycosyltransferase